LYIPFGRGPTNIFRRSRRRSRILFLGNIPDTACRMIWGWANACVHSVIEQK
jgi:hypothetical protein